MGDEFLMAEKNTQQNFCTEAEFSAQLQKYTRLSGWLTLSFVLIVLLTALCWSLTKDFRIALTLFFFAAFARERDRRQGCFIITVFFIQF